jgi:outer membrane protein TolC
MRACDVVYCCLEVFMSSPCSLRRRAPLCLAVLALLALPPAFSAPAGLTLQDAQQLALGQSRKLAAQDAAISASREMAVAAGQLPDPVLKAGIDNLPVSGADKFSLSTDFMTMRRIGVMQELPRAAKRELRAGAFERAADKAGAEKALAAAAVRRDTALAWLELYFSGAMAQVVREQAAEAELESQAVEGGYKGGRASQSDVFAARGALGMVRDRASETGRRVQSARVALARWVGPRAGEELAGLPDLAQVQLDAATLASALVHHPQIAVLEREQEVARAQARLADANRKSDWSVEVAFQQRGSAYSNMLSVGLSVPLQWDRARRQDRELAARLAMVEQAGAERDDALRAHVAETAAMLGDWQNGRERLARYRAELVPLAAERTGAALAAYRGGKSPLAEVLAARRNELDVRLQALQLDADTAKLWAQLNFMAAAGHSANNSQDAK